MQIDIPLEAVVLNFVVNAYEHYDNNGKQDYHVAIALPSGETLDTWRYKVQANMHTQYIYHTVMCACVL